MEIEPAEAALEKVTRPNVCCLILIRYKQSNILNIEAEQSY
jgi:hypothetical protein